MPEPQSGKCFGNKAGTGKASSGTKDFHGENVGNAKRRKGTLVKRLE
jgi:hypothetical protein